MKKLGWHPDVIPQLDSDEDDTAEGNQEDIDPESEDDPGETGDTGYKGKFTSGHIKTWWTQYQRLPPEVRPVFCPTVKFSSSFPMLSEKDIVSILWHKSCRRIKEALELKVCSRDAAADMADNRYGELFHKLFIGDRDEIRTNLSKAQTSYGKRCSTMSRISSSHTTHEADALRSYLLRWFTYLRQKKLAATSSMSSPSPPPELPESPDVHNRYALSNMLRTDGLQIHMLAFDTWKRRQSRNAPNPIKDITKTFPDHDSIQKSFQGAHKDAVIIGVDPGEVISSSFCSIDPRAPTRISNLLVRRSALYAPVMAHRHALQQLKYDGDQAIAHIESSLSQPRYETIDGLESSLQQFHSALDHLHGFYGSTKVKKMR